MNETTLQHWGIKGMKWGVRRYQNKDGTLTALGRKREREMNEKLKSANKELKALRAENETLKKQNVQESRPRTAEGMTDAELNARVNRLNLEQRYKQLMNDLHPQTKSRGQKFVDKLINEVLVPAAVDVGKNTAKNLMNNVVKSALESAAKKDNKGANK